LDEAAVELQNALTIREAKDPNGKGLAHTLGALGKVQALRGDKAKALAFYSRSLEVLQAQDDPDEADITQLMERIAELDAIENKPRRRKG
jgi:hypothetical protein